MGHRTQPPGAAGVTVLAPFVALTQMEVQREDSSASPWLQKAPWASCRAWATRWSWSSSLQEVCRLQGAVFLQRRTCRRRSGECTASDKTRKRSAASSLRLQSFQSTNISWSREAGRACVYEVAKWKVPPRQRLEASDFLAPGWRLLLHVMAPNYEITSPPSSNRNLLPCWHQQYCQGRAGQYQAWWSSPWLTHPDRERELPEDDWTALKVKPLHSR